MRLSERLNSISPLFLHSGLTRQKFSVYVDIFPSYYFCFHYELYLLFLMTFHVTSLNSKSYSNAFAHDISAWYLELRVFSTHIFLIFLTSPSLTHFFSYAFSLYLSLSVCIHVHNMCQTQPCFFFSVELCWSVGIDCLSRCFPCCFALFRVTATFLTCSFFSDSASWSECC